MPRTTLLALLATAVATLAVDVDAAVAADRAIAGVSVSQRTVKRVSVRHMLPTGLPRAHYRYVTTITDGPPVPYDARPFAYGRYAYAPYTNSYGIPTQVIVDPVDPGAYWRPLPYYAAPPYAEAYATPYSCFHYGSC